MEQNQFVYTACPKCTGKFKLRTPEKACTVMFDCPHCSAKLRFVYSGK